MDDRRGVRLARDDQSRQGVLVHHLVARRGRRAAMPVAAGAHWPVKAVRHPSRDLRPQRPELEHDSQGGVPRYANLRCAREVRDSEPPPALPTQTHVNQPA